MNSPVPLPAHLENLTPRDARYVTYLRDSLEILVPIYQARAKTWHPHKREARAKICARELASRGDALQFGSKHHHEALAFEYLAESLALASLQPGGVRAFGVHWQAEL